MRVHFQHTSTFMRMTDQTRHIHLIGFSFINEPAAGMGQDGEMRVVHGTQNALGLFLPGQSEVTMHGSHNKVQPAEVFIGKIQGAVFKNVHSVKAADRAVSLRAGYRDFFLSLPPRSGGVAGAADDAACLFPPRLAPLHHLQELVGGAERTVRS